MSPRNEFMRYFAFAYQDDMRQEHRRTTERPQAGRQSEFPQNESTVYQGPTHHDASVDRYVLSNVSRPTIDNKIMDKL